MKHILTKDFAEFWTKIPFFQNRLNTNSNRPDIFPTHLLVWIHALEDSIPMRWVFFTILTKDFTEYWTKIQFFQNRLNTNSNRPYIYPTHLLIWIYACRIQYPCVKSFSRRIQCCTIHQKKKSDISVLEKLKSPIQEHILHRTGFPDIA